MNNTLKLIVGLAFLASIGAGCAAQEAVPKETKPSEVKLDPAVESKLKENFKGWDPKKMKK